MKIKNLKDYLMVSEAISYHCENGLTLSESIFRVGSDGYSLLVNEARELHYKGKIELSNDDKFIVEKLKTGTKAIFKKRGENDKKVVLDSPDVLPKGSDKEFHVYRDSGKKDDDGNIIAIEIKWGDPNLKVKNCDKDASNSFRARHQCDTKTDMDTPGWWACNVHLFWKQLGLQCNDPW